FRSPSFSPDQQMVVVACEEGFTGRQRICVHDLETGVSTQVTAGPADASPIWSRDGKYLTYESRDSGTAYLKQVALSEPGSIQILHRGGRMSPRAWLPDGRLLFTAVESGEPRMYMDSNPAPRFLWLGSEAQLSPNGE